MNKNKIKAVIIEDEIPAARLLHSMVSRLRPDWDVEVVPGSVEDAINWFSVNKHPDIIFLDIQLSDGLSFDFVSIVKPKSTIIFTTAYDEYAVRAFGVNSIDYILKPVSQERLGDAIKKYESFYELNTEHGEDYLDTILECLTAKSKRYRTRFLIAGVDRMWTIQVEDIAYFYSENKITYAVTNAGVEHGVDFTLDKLTEQLNPDDFYRVNRQFIIGVGAIKKIEPYFNNRVVITVTPQSKEKIIVSKEKISSLKMWLNY